MKTNTGSKRIVGVIVLAGLFRLTAVHAQQAQTSSVPLKTTYVRLANNANAIIVEPAVLDAARSRFAILVVHPERLNTFNYFIGRELDMFNPRNGFDPTTQAGTYTPEFTRTFLAAQRARNKQAGSCASHLVTNEMTFDHSAAKDKQFVAVEGATTTSSLASLSMATPRSARSITWTAG